MTIDPKLLDSLKARFPVAAVEIGAIYAPALARMVLDQLMAVIEQLRTGKSAAAMEAIRDHMTAEELAAEKKALTPLLAAMAEERAEGVRIFNELAMAGLKAALALAIGMVAL